MNRRRMLMLAKSNIKYGLFRPDQSSSSFNFGITWAEVDKVVITADSMQNTVNWGKDDGGNMLLCSYLDAWIGIKQGVFKTQNLSNVRFNLTQQEYNDKANELHDYIISFITTSTKEITNTWDEFWNRSIRYFKIEFWKGDKLLKQFVPDPTNSDRLYDTVNDEYITASQLGVYQLQEVEQ